MDETSVVDEQCNASDCSSFWPGDAPCFGARPSNFKLTNVCEDGARIVRVLLIEDEHKLAAALREGLISDGYSVRVANTGEDGFYQIHAAPVDLVVLDVMLPGRSGLEILKTMRDSGILTPVLMLTARDTTEDRVVGLNAGADDYLVKPFAYSELLARIRSILRRGMPDQGARLAVCDLEMDVVRHTVTRSGQALDLTAREFDILRYLLQNQGKIVSREMLTRDIWKETARHTPLDNVIDVHIARLRRKVDQQFRLKLLQTVRGVGFTIRSEPQ
jgi:two-component system copper resistance phosphate regulon response regulator CusR